MSRIRIPKNAGALFEVAITRASSDAVTNHLSGRNKVFIPCQDREQAEALVQRLLTQDHNGEI